MATKGSTAAFVEKGPDHLLPAGRSGHKGVSNMFYSKRPSSLTL